MLEAVLIDGLGVREDVRFAGTTLLLVSFMAMNFFFFSDDDLRFAMRAFYSFYTTTHFLNIHARATLVLSPPHFLISRHREAAAATVGHPLSSTTVVTAG
jgi:hypothetical protein